MRLHKLFHRRNKYASPYYNGNGALFRAVPFRIEPLDSEQKPEPAKNPSPATPLPAGEQDWERRRFELMKLLIGQERRSVVLGKLRATNKQMARTCRELADAAIHELLTHPLKKDETHEKRDGDDE